MKHDSGELEGAAEAPAAVKRAWWGRYAFGLGVTLVAALLRWSMPELLTPTPFLVFYPAVVLAAALGGFGPGLLAAVGSTLFVASLPNFHFSIFEPMPLARLGIFMSGSVGICLLARMQREAAERERQRNADLARSSEDLAAAKMSAERAKQTAEDASRAKDHFLAVLSHELRTPLTPVVTTVAMLQRRHDFDESTQQSLEVIRRNVELEARLIDDLLDVTRIAKGKIELDRRTINLIDVIHRAVEVVQGDIEGRKLHFGVDGNCGELLVNGDATRLQQVFWNLLRNAIKFTPQGGCVGIRCRTQEKGWVCVEVNDSGLGISPTALRSIFDAFEQAERSITRQFGGLGLGLTISKAMVEMHGGTIEAHSAGKGKGATFKVHLPMATAPAVAESRTVAGGGASLRRLRILLVEDHGDSARVMRRLLMSDGHEVEWVGDVATAMDSAQRGAFDLLLSDLGLPDRSGLELLEELRTRGCRMPAIALSGYGQEQDIQRSREAGFAAHLTKPTTPERLSEVMEMVMRRG